MPYAIFSKRTRVINRIVDDLSSLLPSESMIEVDREINYPKEVAGTVRGQDINTYSMPLFVEGGTPTTKMMVRGVLPNGRPRSTKNPPRYVEPTLPTGDPKQVRSDVPIVSYPFGWTAEGLFRVKYQSILSQNYPYDVLIGEEFMDDEHIDAGSSSNYVLTEGVCALAPGGIFVTSSFSFTISKELAATTTHTASRYMFDTYYLDTSPDINDGIEVYWRGVRYDGATTTAWQPMITNQAMPTTEVLSSETTATHLRSIQLRFSNLTGGVFALENYLLFLALRKTIIYAPAP